MLSYCSALRIVLLLLMVALASACSATQFKAIDFSHTTIYHSPQYPGYTCWVGTWLMPDKSIMVAFTQATGPVEGRPKAPKEVMEKLSWLTEYDMTGLDLRNVHLRSWDRGKTWNKISADPFTSTMNGCSGEPETALPDGTILRGVWGQYLCYNPELPKTGYIQRSKDGSKTWGKPEVLLDPKTQQAWPKRIRALKDGRVIVLGGLANIDASKVNRAAVCAVLEPMLLVSSNNGRTWSKPAQVIPEQNRKGWAGEEYDAAELANGDLLCVFRRVAPEGGREVIWQGILKKTGRTWVPQEVGPSPLPMAGHPELITTREGPVVFASPYGCWHTADKGKNWTKLEVPGTGYYPRGVQADDGRILIFGHAGNDDPYGRVDQSIVMNSFRLEQVKTGK